MPIFTQVVPLGDLKIKPCPGEPTRTFPPAILSFVVGGGGGGGGAPIPPHDGLPSSNALFVIRVWPEPSAFM
jgi:hypothetical protein